MSFIARNPLIAPEVENVPFRPIDGTRGIFASKDGWYDIDAYGTIKRMSTDALSYKGSLESTSSLPSDPSTGDMYNIETESSITVTGTNSKIRYLIPILGVVDSHGEFSAHFNSEYFSWLNRETVEIELFDRYGDSLGIALMASLSSDGEIEIWSASLAPGTFINYIQLPNQEDNENAPGEPVTVYEKKDIVVMPKQKVFYNGKEWDVFLTANFDSMDVLNIREATFEEIDEALNNIFNE